MTFTFKIPFAMYVGFKIFKNKFMNLKSDQHDGDQAQIWCIKNIHASKKLKPGDDPGYMDFKFNVMFNNSTFTNQSMSEVQMMMQTVLDSKEYLHTV